MPWGHWEAFSFSCPVTVGLNPGLVKARQVLNHWVVSSVPQMHLFKSSGEWGAYKGQAPLETEGPTLTIIMNFAGSPRPALQFSLLSVRLVLPNLSDLLCILRTISFALLWFCIPRFLLLFHFDPSPISLLLDRLNSTSHLKPAMFTMPQLSSFSGAITQCLGVSTQLLHWSNCNLLPLCRVWCFHFFML